MKKIVENEIYSLENVCRYIGVDNRQTCNRRVTDDMLGANLLKCKMIGEGNARRYYIKGKYLLNYIKKWKR